MRNLLLFISIQCSLAAQHIVSVRWSATPAFLANQTAIVRVASGARLEGEWRSVTPNSFTMFVRKSSGGPAQTGRVTMERTDLENLSFRPLRFAGRLGVPWAGFLVGELFGVSAGGIDGSRVGGAIGLAVGYGLGRIRDRAPISVLILPDDAPYPPPPADPHLRVPSHSDRVLLRDAIGQE